MVRSGGGKKQMKSQALEFGTKFNGWQTPTGKIKSLHMLIESNQQLE